MFAADAVFAAQTNPLAGTWHGITPVKGMTPISIDLVLSADGRFGERTKYNGGKSMIFGKYDVVSKNSLHFDILDWEPRQECTSVRCDTVVKPPDLYYNVEYLSSSGMVLKDKKFGTVLILTRVRQAPLKKATTRKSS